MKVGNFKILTPIAALNSIILGLIAYLSVFMYRNNIGKAEDLAYFLILTSLIASLVTKIKMKSLAIVLISILFDFIMVVYLYNPADFKSISSFIYSLLDIESHAVVFVYLYLILFYYLKIRDLKST